MTATVLHSSVLDTLGREIVSGQIPSGGVLTLEQLQERFGVSRTVVRECMRILESINLIHSRRRVGIVVRPPSEWTVLDARIIHWRLEGPGRDAQLRNLTELRLAVEPVAAGGPRCARPLTNEIDWWRWPRSSAPSGRPACSRSSSRSTSHFTG